MLGNIKISKPDPKRVLAGLVPFSSIILAVMSAYYLVVYKTMSTRLAECSMAICIHSWMMILVMHVLIALFVTCLVLTVITEPGAIPNEWFAGYTRRLTNPSDHNYSEAPPSYILSKTRERKVSSESGVEYIRFCGKCQAFKPDRCHHCSSCGRCVLKMDHHCVFIFQCVGFYNHKFFVLMLIYGWIGCLISFYYGLPLFVRLVKEKDQAMDAARGGHEHGNRMLSLNSSEQVAFSHDHHLSHDFDHVSSISPSPVLSSIYNHATLPQSPADFHIVAIAFVITAAMSISLLIFVALHIHLILKGRTTIEMYELTDPDRNSFCRMYDLGYKRNWTQVFGENKWMWFLPTRVSCPGDGIEFPTKSASLEHELLPL